jgi:purine-cytosine permease-like protein
MPPRRSEPVGAIVLIGLGVMFLLSSMGILRMHWLGHAWPILLIAIGGWLIFKRTRDVPDGGVK